MAVLVVVVVVSKKRTISIPQTWQEPQSLQSASSSCNVLFYFKHQYQFLHLRNKKILSFDFTQINHPQIWVTALSPKSLYTVFRAEAPSDNCLNRCFRWKIKECRKVLNAGLCTWKYFAENSAFLCFATLPQMLWVLNAPDFLLNTLLRTKRGQKFAPKYQRLRKSKCLFAWGCKKFSQFTIGFEKYGNGNFGPWIKEIVNSKHFEFVNISNISSDCLRYSYCLCNICVSAERKFSGTSNKNDHKTRK